MAKMVMVQGVAENGLVYVNTKDYPEITCWESCPLYQLDKGIANVSTCSGIVMNGTYMKRIHLDPRAAYAVFSS